MWIAGVVLLLSGCGPARPTLLGGKPVAYWVEALRGPDVKLRIKAVRKLGNLGQADPAALPAVVGALKDADARVRREAVLALVKFGADAREAVTTLTELERRDADAQVREYAGRALAKIREEIR
jgi:HEAT repeat protein